MAYTTIDKPDLYFNTLTWTGDGSSSRNITGVGFQPDWVWGKCRNATVSHAVYDSVRGASNLINTNTTSAEGTNPALNGFISDGFTVNSDSYLNLNNNTYVAWNWLASNTTASNTNGSITSTVSANTTSGFSIVSYTGNSSNSQTVGHGLGVAPSMVIIKNRVRSDEGWWTQHTSFADGTYYALLNSNSSAGNSGGTNIFNGFPTSTVFKLNDGRGVNESGSGHIAYCFAEKKGYSKFGSYTGNGSTDGTFIYTGFKPAWVMVKCTSAAESWDIKDNKRNPYNTCDNGLRANQNSSDDINTTYHMIDYLTNGFKLRGANQNLVNGSGQSYIYMAFAENPFVSSTGVPATAR